VPLTPHVFPSQKPVLVIAVTDGTPQGEPRDKVSIVPWKSLHLRTTC